MRDPFNDGGDTVGRGDLEEGVDTGGVNPGQVAGSGPTISGGQDVMGGSRADLASDDEIRNLQDDLQDIFVEHGAGRERYESIDDVYQEQAEERARMEAEDAAEEALAAERARLEAEKDAAREEAHANGDAFYEGDVRYNGEDCQEWTLPDGTTVIVNDEGEAVSVEWPPGEGPVYIGDVLVGGEPHAVYELPTGTQIVVDDDGNTIGTLDDIDVDDTSVPLYWITGDKADADEMVTVEVIPDPDGSYDTLIVDAETGEVLKELDTGSEALGYNVGQTGTAGQEIYQTYVPPGSDYYLVIDSDGNVVGTHPIPEDPEWSLFGVVEYYEGGKVVVDLGATEIAVDVVGPDGGISVDFDVLVAEGTAGVEWNEDGSWEFSTSVDVDAGIAEIELDAAVGQDGEGMWHIDVETWMEMQTGGLNLEGGQHFHFQETDEGFEVNVGWEGKVSSFGFYVERAQDFTMVLDDEGGTFTYQDMIGAGHEWMGGLQLTSENQIRVSEDGDVEGTTGVHARIVDSDGDEVIGGGTYLDSEQGGPMSQREQLDTGRDYERQYDDGRPAGPNVDDDAEMGAGDVDRFGLGGQRGEEREDGSASGRRWDVSMDPERGIIPTGETAMEDVMARRIGTARSGDSPEPPVAVIEAMAGRYADAGTSARHLLADAPGGDRFISFGTETTTLRDVGDAPGGERMVSFGTETTTLRDVGDAPGGERMVSFGTEATTLRDLGQGGDGFGSWSEATGTFRDGGRRSADGPPEGSTAGVEPAAVRGGG